MLRRRGLLRRWGRLLGRWLFGVLGSDARVGRREARVGVEVGAGVGRREDVGIRKVRRVWETLWGRRPWCVEVDGSIV